MTKDLLPAYFKEYMDERFNSVTAKIDELSDDISQVKSTVDSLKKKMDGVEFESKVNDGSIKSVSKLLKFILIVLAIISITLLLHLNSSERNSFLQSIFRFL